MAEETLTTTPEEPQAPVQSSTEEAAQAPAETVAPAAEAPAAEAPAAEAPAAEAQATEASAQPAAYTPRTPERGPTDLATELQNPTEDAPLKEVPNGRAYEITYIVRANDPEGLANSQTRLTALVETVGGAVDNIRVSETRRLAYPIRKLADGVYVVVNARFEKGLVEELDRFFKLEEAVLRHIVLRKDS